MKAQNTKNDSKRKRKETIRGREKNRYNPIKPPDTRIIK